MVMRSRDLERKYARLDGQMAEYIDTVATILDVQVKTAGGYAAAAKRGLPPNAVPGTVPGTVPGPIPEPVQATTPEAAILLNPAAAPLEPPPEKEADKASDGNDFRLPREQLKINERRNGRAIFGKKEGTALKGGERRKEIFVFNLDGETTEEDVKTLYGLDECEGY